MKFRLLLCALLVKTTLFAQLPLGHHESYVRLNIPLTNRVTTSFMEGGMVLITEDKNYVRSYFLNLRRFCTLYAIQPKTDSLATVFEKQDLKNYILLEDGVWQTTEGEHVVLIKKLCTSNGKEAYFYFEDREENL